MIDNKSYIRPANLAENLDVSIRTIYRWQKEEGFPMTYKIGHNTTVFKVAEVNAWLKQQESRQAQPKKNSSHPTVA